MKRRYWSEDQREILRLKYPVMSIKELARLLKRSISSVRNEARKMRLTKARQDAWAGWQLKILHDEYPALGCDEVARLTGRSRASVLTKAYKLKVSFDGRPKAFSDDEIDVVVINYPRIGPSAVASLLKRSPSSVMNCANRLGVKFSGYPIPWSEGDDDVIREVFPLHGSGGDYSRLSVKRTKCAIARRAIVLGVRVTSVGVGRILSEVNQKRQRRRRSLRARSTISKVVQLSKRNSGHEYSGV